MASLDTNQITWDQEEDQDLLLIHCSPSLQKNILTGDQGLQKAGKMDSTKMFNDEKVKTFDNTKIMIWIY